jgi:pimeloyl-ACP methyl ester carboxylesterase
MVSDLGDVRTVRTSVLDVAYHDSGPPDGPPVVLLHGFPYDPLSYEAVAPTLAARGMRVITPYLRGYGWTRFLDAGTPRSGEQAALGNDLIEVIEALALDRPVVAGYDWGGRAACITAAVRPDLVRGLVSVAGYNLFGPPITGPGDPESEHRLWYQYYLHMHRGRMMLNENRRGFCRLLWKLWSPTWEFTDETFERSARSFDNADFVEVVLHSYRHRSGLVPGDPALAALASRLERRPDITVPTIVLHGASDMAPLHLSVDRSRFTGRYDRRVIHGAGHNPPQETPAPVIAAIVELTEDRSA